MIRPVLLLLVAWMAGCGNTVPSVPPLPPEGVILAFGDSLTYGTGARSEDSYPAVLERLTRRKVVNAGIPGEVSGTGLARLPALLETVQPTLLVLCHGGNDFLRKLDDGQTAENLRAMIRTAAGQGIAVVMIGVPKPGFFPKPPAFYSDVAAEFGIPYEPDILKEVLSDTALKSDLVHPNARGYAKIAEAVADLLGQSGAI